jgi:uncharacterized protein YdaU (DUF1376 family)
LNYYEHHLGDWAAATGHLTWDEDMAYTRLLRAYYHHEKPIAEGQQYRLAKASTPVQRRAVDQVLQEFFELRDGHYHQKRADAEIAKYREKEPEREAKKDNERERQRRTRERRKALFDLLRDNGVVPAYDAPMSELQTLASRLQSRDVTQPVTRDATATHTQSQTPDTREEGEKAPQPPAAVAAPSPRPERGTRLPAGWSPGPEQTAFAESLGIRNGVAAAELEKFRDYWAALPGQKGVKTDWTATWRNWLRRVAEDRPGVKGGGQQPAFDLDGVQ